MLKSILAGLLTLSISSATIANETTSPDRTKAGQSQTMVTGTFFNMPMYDAAGNVPPGQTMAFNPADPTFWMQWAKPSMHTKMHMAFTNPAQYAQMMNPAFYTQMMNPAVWMKWMNPASFQVLMNPKTMSYWIQPGAYMHAMSPAGYMQMIDPQAYAKLTSGVLPQTADSQAMSMEAFNPFAWFQQYVPAQSTKKADG